MYACIRGTGRIFSRGCAVERIGYLLLKTRPSRFVNRLLEIRSSSTPPVLILVGREYWVFEKISSLRRWAMNAFRAVCDHTPGHTPRNNRTYVQSVIHNGRVHASSRKGGSVMFARVSKYSVDSERLQQEQGEVEEHLLPALRMQPGFSGGLLLANTQKGKVLAVTLWESEQEMHATDEASHWFRVFGAAAVEGTVTDVETY